MPESFSEKPQDSHRLLILLSYQQEIDPHFIEESIIVPDSGSAAPQQPSSPKQGFSCFTIVFTFSLLLNIVVGIGLVIAAVIYFWQDDSGSDKLADQHHSGSKDADAPKIAILNIQGVLFEGMLSYPHQQIKTIAQDDQVKAVVVRVTSPGGTVSASDELYRQIVELRDGTSRYSSQKKVLVTSIGPIAASGGYYISAPAARIFAERTSTTGSIGVYAAFPNVEKLATKHGIKMDVVKRGEVKHGGSPFKTMTPAEREVWQDLVDNAYRQFLSVIGENRPHLKNRMRDLVINELRAPAQKRDETLRLGVALIGQFPVPCSSAIWGQLTCSGALFQNVFLYQRRRADGGIFTAEQALRFGLIDEIGGQDAAIKTAAKLADLGSEYQVVSYQRDRSVAEMLLGLKVGSENDWITTEQLRRALTPRLWYLSPQAELAGLLEVMRP